MLSEQDHTAGYCSVTRGVGVKASMVYGAEFGKA